MTNSNLLNVKIQESGIKIGHIARVLNLSRQGLYNKINGKTEFFGSEITKLSEILNLSIEERENIFFNPIVDCKET